MNNNVIMNNQAVNEMPAISTILTSADIEDQLKSHGLHGLEFDHSSFPTICLRSTFEMSDDPSFNLNGFDVTIMHSQQKYILTDIAEESKRVLKVVKYSKDAEVTTDGELVADCMRVIREHGGHPVLKKYLDLLVQLHTNDHHDRKLAILSISPTSVSRVSGLFYQLQLQGKLDKLQDLRFNVCRGQQRVSRGGQTYWLWQITPKAVPASQAA